MRVTTTGFTETFKRQTNDSLYRQYQLQDKIASGLAFTKSSDNPTSFALLKFQQTQQSETIGFEGATTEAKLQATRNYEAMADLQRTLSRANELMQRSNGAVGSEGLKAIGAEMETLLSTVQSVANRNYDGYYSFGSTNNSQPVPTSTFASVTYGTGNGLVKQIQVAPNSNAVDVAILAGEPAAALVGAAGPPFTTSFIDTAPIAATQEGFLVKSGATGSAAGSTTVGNGVDILGFIHSAATTLKNGLAVTQDQRVNMLRAGEYIAEYVGKTSATLAQFDLNKQALNSVKQTGLERIANLSEADLPGLSTDLARTQQAYQGALASGSKLLQISLLDYLR